MEKRISELKLHPNARYFLIDLRQISEEELRRSKECLNSEDQQRAMRFHAPKRQSECLLTYMLIKEQLGKILGESPSKLPFLRNPYGKPYLHAHPLHFNLSHAGSYAFLGVHFENPIGVDIEKRAREIPWEIFLCSPHEKQWLEKNVYSQESAIQLWSAKEAYVKALGVGFSQSIPVLEPHQKTGVFLARLSGFAPLVTTVYDKIVTDYQLATCIHYER